MLLLIDFGNTRIKACITKNNTYQPLYTFEGHSSEFNIWISEYKNSFESYCYASVLDQELIHDSLQQLHRMNKTNREWSVLSPLPVQINYTTPHTLGQDRLCGVIAAQALFPTTSTLVIDAGTCIKYDYVDAKKVYHGGAISLGLNLRFKALHNFTSQLPFLNCPTDDVEWIGTSTKSALESGVIHGTIGEIEHFINYYKSLDPSLNVLFTGGDAKYLQSRIKNTIFANQNLVLLGLFQIAYYLKYD